MVELSAVQSVLLLLAVGAVALLYSSVGHGGATGYLAVMALLGIGPALARPGALWINCVVASIAFARFRRAGYFDLRVFLPLASASVPLAWFGSQLGIDGLAYAWLLGATLAVAGWFIGWGRHADDRLPAQPPALPTALAAGSTLGFLAGATGIGGGVFLTPLLVHQHWVPAKTAAGISALFIVVNSVAGLAGLGRVALLDRPGYLVVPAVAVLGALCGTQLGVHRWSTTTFRRALAVVLWIAAAKLLITGR
jgi:hypothetical protein